MMFGISLIHVIDRVFFSSFTCTMSDDKGAHFAFFEASLTFPNQFLLESLAAVVSTTLTILPSCAQSHPPRHGANHPRPSLLPPFLLAPRLPSLLGTAKATRSSHPPFPLAPTLPPLRASVSRLSLHSLRSVHFERKSLQDRSFSPLKSSTAQRASDQLHSSKAPLLSLTPCLAIPSRTSSCRGSRRG